MMRTARMLLLGGPFDGEEAARVPMDFAAPAQVVWSGWAPWGFDSWLYEYRGERRGEPVDTLIYRPTGRRLTPDEIPPVIVEMAELWAAAAELLLASPVGWVS